MVTAATTAAAGGGGWGGGTDAVWEGRQFRWKTLLGIRDSGSAPSTDKDVSLLQRVTEEGRSAFSCVHITPHFLKLIGCVEANRGRVQ